MPRLSSLRRLALVAVASALSLSAASAESGTARKTIDEMIAALGGQAFLKVRDIHNTGRYYSFHRGQLDIGNVFEDYIRFPGAERTELGAGKYRSVSINGEGAGWMIEGDSVWEQSPEDLANFSTSFETSYEYVTRFIVDDPDVALVDLGVETVDFRRADGVEFRDGSGRRIRYYIDRETRLPLKMTVRLAGETQTREETYANWHRFDGVQTPLFMARFRDGVKVMEIRMETVRYNSGLADSLFAP